MTLDAAYITAAEHRARRFQGAYTGTSGTLAADVIRLINERAAMQTTIEQLEQDNQALRDAVETRLAGGVVAAEAACSEGGCYEAATDEEYERQHIPADWILRGERELKAEREQPEPRPLGAGVMNATTDAANASEELLLDALSAVRDRRTKYGPPVNHFAITVRLINACFGTSFTESDWATIMVLDKIARSRGPMDCRDNDVDLAGYAACRAECRAP